MHFIALKGVFWTMEIIDEVQGGLRLLLVVTLTGAMGRIPDMEPDYPVSVKVRIVETFDS